MPFISRSYYLDISTYFLQAWFFKEMLFYLEVYEKKIWFINKEFHVKTRTWQRQ
jgi:hypothetical protein